MIRDPEQVESAVEMMPGLGLLPVETTFAAASTIMRHPVSAQVLDGPGWLQTLKGQNLTGYEIHMGRTVGGRPWLTIQTPVDHVDGTASADGNIWGCYLHGLFANDAFRRAWVTGLHDRGRNEAPVEPDRSAIDSLDAALDRLADAVGLTLDMKRLHEIVAV